MNSTNTKKMYPDDYSPNISLFSHCRQGDLAGGRTGKMAYLSVNAQGSGCFVIQREKTAEKALYTTCFCIPA